ncbi:hypothetical protein [Burkholderia plantarii]|uniref:hypothetical protein n=1 Tax=Burkholderia plantarii TaxID=41899 RepID=UPI0011DF7673|nr:hypothetical protein [Burkholderia plantarii]
MSGIGLVDGHGSERIRIPLDNRLVGRRGGDGDASAERPMAAGAGLVSRRHAAILKRHATASTWLANAFPVGYGRLKATRPPHASSPADVEDFAVPSFEALAGIGGPPGIPAAPAAPAGSRSGSAVPDVPCERVNRPERLKARRQATQSRSSLHGFPRRTKYLDPGRDGQRPLHG